MVFYGMYDLVWFCLVMCGLVWPFAAMHNFCACFLKQVYLIRYIQANCVPFSQGHIYMPISYMLLLQAIDWVEVTLWCTNLSKFLFKIGLLNEVYLGQLCTCPIYRPICLFPILLLQAIWWVEVTLNSSTQCYFTFTSYRVGSSDPRMHRFEQIFIFI